jgi:hypothetical protein
MVTDAPAIITIESIKETSTLFLLDERNRFPNRQKNEKMHLNSIV